MQDRYLQVFNFRRQYFDQGLQERDRLTVLLLGAILLLLPISIKRNFFYETKNYVITLPFWNECFYRRGGIEP